MFIFLSLQKVKLHLYDLTRMYIRTKSSDKSKLRDIQQDNWPVLLKNLNVIKDKSKCRKTRVMTIKLMFFLLAFKKSKTQNEGKNWNKWPNFFNKEMVQNR